MRRGSTFTREAIADGPSSMWRYQALLPVPDDLRADHARRLDAAAAGATASASGLARGNL